MAATKKTQADMVTGAGTARPYSPSWVDRVTDWVDSLPGPSWAFYLAAWLLLFVVETAIKWYDGAYPPGTLFPHHIVFALSGVYFIALIHYLDRRAQDALRTFRPAWAASESDYEDLRYRLTTLPARPTLLWSAGGLLLFVLLVILVGDPRTSALLKLNTSLSATMFETFVSALAWSLQGAFAYHTIHQLRLVSHVYARANDVNLFRPDPLYAFAGLSARTAVGAVLIPYATIVTTPGVLENPGTILTGIPLNLLAILVFLWPLLGMQHLLAGEKKRLQDENARQIESIISQTHGQLNAGDLSSMSLLKDTMQNLVTQREAIDKLRTWPWQPGTIRGLATALFLPVVLWIIERILERFLNF